MPASDDVTVELRVPPGPAVPGSVLEVEVRVRSASAGSARALVVRLLCLARVQDEVEEKDRAVATERDPAWPAGGGSFRLSVEVPKSLETFEGNRLRAEWFVEAELSHGYAGSPIRQPIVVRTPGTVRSQWDSLPAVPTPLVHTATETASTFLGSLGCSAGLVAGAAAIIGAALAVYGDGGGLLALVLFGLPAVAGVVTVWMGWARDRRLGGAQVRIGPVRARRGQAIFAEVRWAATQPLRLEEAKISLVAQERADRRVRRHKKRDRVVTHTHELARIVEPMRASASGLQLISEGACVVPGDALLPFKREMDDGDFKMVEAVSWTVELSVDFDGVVAWTTSVPVVIERDDVTLEEAGR